MPDPAPPVLRVGVDTGGTFTDFVIVATDGVRTHKVLSTPDAPERAILAGIRELGLAHDAIDVCHGSTVATNAVLEGRGGRVAFVTNRGFADLLTIGRQARSRLYTLSEPAQAPPVPADHCLETGGRLDARGATIDPLGEGDLAALLRALEALDPDTVAVTFLHAYLDDGHERRVEAALAGRWPVSRSSAVLAEIGEYERAVATWLNAYVAPRTQQYLARLRRALGGSLAVMQSDGLLIDADQAAAQGVRLLLSGPAGGLVGARKAGEDAGFRRLLTVDVGGTSTDVALIDGEVRITREGRLGGYPVAVPMVDMHTVGAGGGSIASIDPAGLLHVGPRSAGADPGPACYGRGGHEPTLTDAMLVAGRLPAGGRLGRSGPTLSLAGARRALEPLAEALGRDLAATAEAVIRLANERMAGALRAISVQRGVDPADFALCAFGGAGGLHACELADLLGMERALVPAHAGVLSALGMVASAPGREATFSLLRPVAELTDAEAGREFERLAAPLRRALAAEGARAEHGERRADLRYAGQSFTLDLPWRGVRGAAERFHAAHERRFGHALEAPVEVVNLRVRVRSTAPRLTLEASDPPDVHRHGRCIGSFGEGEKRRGPAILLDRAGACWLPPHWGAQRDAHGHLLLERLE